MSRRRNRGDEPSPFEHYIDALLTLPWWAGTAVAMLLYVSMRSLIPWILLNSASDTPKLNGTALNPAKLILEPFARVLHSLALPAFILSLGLVVIGRLLSWLRRPSTSRVSSSLITSEQQRNTLSNAPRGVQALLDKSQVLKNVGQLSWSEFEELPAAVFRRAGFCVQRTGSDQADGGIDLVLTKDDERTIVQCKHWQVLKVPVSVVREQLGLKQSFRAHHCIIVTSGAFTADAIKFALQNGIILLNGTALQSLLADPTAVSIPQMIDLSQVSVLAGDCQIVAPACPECGGTTTKKVATKGQFKGQPFWACVRYPTCYGKIDAAEMKLTR